MRATAGGGREGDGRAGWTKLTEALLGGLAIGGDEGEQWTASYAS